MKVVYFYNFSDQDFTGQWGGEPTLVKAGAKEPMEDWRAAHFAKHLANREVLKLPGGDSHTSPKFPEQDPFFNDLFRKAQIPIADSPDVTPEHIELEVAKEVLSPKGKAKAKPVTKPTKQAEEVFEGLED